MGSDRVINIKGVKFIPKRCLKGYPVKVIEEIVSEAKRQGNKEGVAKILRNLDENVATMLHQGGFTWMNSPEGVNFWGAIINGCEPKRRRFNLIFKTDRRNFIE